MISFPETAHENDRAQTLGIAEAAKVPARTKAERKSRKPRQTSRSGSEPSQSQSGTRTSTRTPEVTLTVDGVVWHLRPDVLVQPGNTAALLFESREVFWSKDNEDRDVGELIREAIALSKDIGRPDAPPPPSRNTRTSPRGKLFTARLLIGDDEWTVYPLVKETGDGFVMILPGDRQIWFGDRPDWDGFGHLFADAFAISMRRPDFSRYAHGPTLAQALAADR